jgi:hypothetical protein
MQWNWEASVLAKTICAEVIQPVVIVVRKSVLEGLRKAGCCSLCIDSTSHPSHVDQLLP